MEAKKKIRRLPRKLKKAFIKKYGLSEYYFVNRFIRQKRLKLPPSIDKQLKHIR